MFDLLFNVGPSKPFRDISNCSMKYFSLDVKWDVGLGQMCLPNKAVSDDHFNYSFFIFQSVYVMMLRSWREVSSK